MISRSLRFAFSYTERAFTPAAYTSLLQATLPSLSPPVLLPSLRKSCINFTYMNKECPISTTICFKTRPCACWTTNAICRYLTY